MFERIIPKFNLQENTFYDTSRAKKTQTLSVVCNMSTNKTPTQRGDANKNPKCSLVHKSSLNAKKNTQEKNTGVEDCDYEFVQSSEYSDFILI
jgi:hypothetical protein